MATGKLAVIVVEDLHASEAVVLLRAALREGYIGKTVFEPYLQVIVASAKKENNWLNSFIISIYQS